MDKPSVYIETSIVSYLAADPSRHPVTRRNQQLTHAWWNTQTERYTLFTSRFVISEAALGDVTMAKRRLALLAPISLLVSREPVLEFALALQRGIPLPEKAKEDALHIAVAAADNVDYLLTWDCTHIANPRLLHRMERISAAWGYVLPQLCTPADLL
jgi:hypothetical protein